MAIGDMLRGSVADVPDQIAVSKLSYEGGIACYLTACATALARIAPRG